MFPELIIKNLNLFVCPRCGGELKSQESNKLSCLKKGHVFELEENIPLLFWSNEWGENKVDVTDKIKSFYEKVPFPNYDDLDSVESLRRKAERGIFARLLDEQIPFGSKILEVGCGTGQLSNFLATTWGRTIFGSDMCLNSLRLGNRFRNNNNIKNVAFVQMNLFKPVFKPETFDYLICNGVLHHTSDPYLGFKSIAKLVKKNGFILVGLYNAYGRIPTHVRRFIFKISGNRFKFLDYHLRRKDVGDVKKQTWFMDQYQNPHESDHTMDEVLRWFKEEECQFMNGIPKLISFDDFSSNEKLFEPHPVGTKLDHVLSQFNNLLGGGKEGGFFIMVGKKIK
jgi:ubiquinone/menaquinone biosynthesis C-methylase UbiE